VTRVWDRADGRERRRLGRPADAARALALSADGKLLASAGRGAIRLHDTATGKEARAIPWKGDRPDAIAFARDGKLLAACALDGTIRLYEGATGKEVRHFNEPAGVRPLTTGQGAVAFAPDDKLLVSAGVEQVKQRYAIVLLVWDPAAGKELHRIEGVEGEP